MARSGLADLIARLRDMANVGTADWSDDELQAVLDRYRLDVHREELIVQPSYNGGAALYYDYYSRYGNFEATDGGTAIFVVEDSTGAKKGTADWTANYINGHISFSVDQAGAIIYLTGRSYDLNGAAAQVWRQQAGKQAPKYSYGGDGKTFSRSDWFKHCMEMAAYYDRLSRPTVVDVMRTDVTP